jgi:hypothetical protein
MRLALSYLVRALLCLMLVALVLWQIVIPAIYWLWPR